MVHAALRRFAIALSFSALSGTAAHAQSASVVLDWSKFAIEVVDTNPADGVAASVTIEYPNSGTFGCLSAAWGACADTYAGHSDWITASVTDHAFGSMSGRAGYDASNVHASASGASPSGWRGIAASRGAQLTFTGDAQVTMRLPYTLSVDATGADTMHGSFAYASLGATAMVADSTDWQEYFKEYYISTPWDGTMTHSGQLELGWTQAAGIVHFNALAAARLDEDPIRPPIPEPGTWAMLLAGAALVARRAARQTR